jgi:hypothetical protein
MATLSIVTVNMVPVAAQRHPPATGPHSPRPKRPYVCEATPITGQPSRNTFSGIGAPQGPSANENMILFSVRYLAFQLRGRLADRCLKPP